MSSALPPFCVHLADQTLRLHVRHLETRSYCQEYLTEDPGTEDVLPVTVTSEDVVREWKYFLSRPGFDKAFVNRLPGYYFEISALHRKVTEALLPCGVMAFHGSCVALDQEGYLFTAPSGTGKSTHTKLWTKAFGSRAQIVNDDKPFLKVQPDGTVRAYGSPWCGKHHRGANISVPLRAICVLHRSSEAAVEELDKEEILPRLMEQTLSLRTKEFEPKLRALLTQIAAGTAFFAVGSNLSADAPIQIHQEIQARLERI